MLIQSEQKPWKLVVVGEQEGKTEGRRLGGKQRKAAVTAPGLLLLQLEGQKRGKERSQTVLPSLSSGSGVLAPASFPESRQE